MKTSLLSVSAFVLASLIAAVGCSTPTSDLSGEDDEEETSGAQTKETPKPKPSSSSADEGDDDDDNAPAPATKTTPAPTSTTPAPTTTPAGGGAACDTCLGTNAAAKSYVACTSTCTDDQCDEDCFQSSCGADANACDASLEKCEAQCFGAETGPGGDDDDDDDDVGGGGDACLSCLGTSPAAQYIQCSDKCQDDQCDDDCFEQACGANADACESKLDQCACFE